MKLTAKLILSITIITIIIITATTNYMWVSQKNLLMQQAHAQAKTLFEMLVVTRQWVAENRDEITPVPAVATKQLSEYASVMTDFRFHITSDILINPENAPDKFELKAMKMFRKDAREYSEITTINNEKFYRYMAPLYVNNACLECHEYQGYKVGDLRGGISVMLPLKKIETAIAENNKNYYLMGLLSFIGIVITISLLLRFLVLKNIATLTSAASSYKTGDFSETICINTRDEIQELAEAFEVMRTSILENEDNLKSELSKVTQNYNKLLENVKERNEELRDINIFKTDILDSLSHELRTPLTKIMAYSSLLIQQGTDCNVEVKDKALDAINRSAKLLNNLFNEVITLSRLESNQHPYHFIPVEIEKMIKDTAEIFEKEISDKSIKVNLEIPFGAVTCIDGESFKHVLSNLISNGVKFNKKGGSLTVRYCEAEKYKILEFEDTGAGIPKDEIEKITQRFYRGTNVKREFSGTGLGLSIVQRIVDGHSGYIEVESEVNKGTIFRIYIPRKLKCSKSLDTTDCGNNLKT